MSGADGAAKAALLAAAPLARLVGDIIEGKVSSPADVARSLIGIGLTQVPRAQLIEFLTPSGVERAELLADLADRAKFG